MPEEITWTVGGNGVNPPAKALPFVGTWSTFSKLPEEEKAKQFNAIRGACIVAGLMENK